MRAQLWTAVVVLSAGLSACGGGSSETPGASRFTDLSPPLENSAAAHTVPTDASGQAIQGSAAALPLAKPRASDPSFVGVWAAGIEQCADAKQTTRISMQRLEMGQTLGCNVTGASADDAEAPGTWRVAAACIGQSRSRNDLFTLSTDDSGRQLELRRGEEEPQRLLRCPAS